MEETGFPQTFAEAKRGDESAQERLFASALGIALAVARGELREGDRRLLESDDVRQSVLIRLYRRLPDLSFSVQPELIAWLRETTVRLVREKRRNAMRQKRDLRRNTPYPTGGLPAETSRSLDRVLTRLAVIEALEKLPEDTAAVVRLRALEGRSFVEVARDLGLPGPDAARKRYTRAMVRLNELMQGG